MTHSHSAIKLKSASANVGLHGIIKSILNSSVGLFQSQFKMIALLLLVGAVTFFYVYVKWCYGYWNRKKVPAPDPSFFVGNVGPTLIFTNHLGLMIEDWYK